FESLKVFQRQLFRSLEDWEVSSLQFMQRIRNRRRPININHVKDSELASVFGKLKYEENDFQDSPDDEEDTRSSHEYLNNLEEYQARALLAKSKRFFKKAKYNKVKAKLALLSSSASALKAATVKNKGLIIEAYEWDKEEVASDDNEMVEVKVLMALAGEKDAISKEGARNGE
ncbi:hypothetical protein Tco_1355823, partial [Tanacetum coccineum]